MKLAFITALALACALSVAGCGGDGAGTNTAPSNAGASKTGASPAEAQIATEAMPDGAFRAGITAENPPAKLTPGQKVELKLRIKNNGSAAWPMRGRPGTGHFQVNIGDHWYDPDGKEVKYDERLAQPFSIGPGQEAEVVYAIIAPSKAGEYVVEIDMVQEMVAWFKDKGSQPARLNVRVE